MRKALVIFLAAACLSAVAYFKFSTSISSGDYSACELAAKYGMSSANEITENCKEFDRLSPSADSVMECSFFGKVTSTPEELNYNDKAFIQFTFYVDAATNNGRADYDCAWRYSKQEIYVRFDKTFWIDIQNISKKDALYLNFISKSIPELPVTEIFTIIHIDNILYYFESLL
ncbi:hypothetical protein [Pseudomonas fluorescens]|uniref:Uncharacterized protein n=1 Tax=Pseudomonas fluorescens TaxID=294 RepID=A0A5E7N4C9_PSEFL|nr:hypothetical protein [Pseudomonas fluorescens]VVP31193.1 hypothetical protein PS880_04348 [Pseudomonas fluorescens]